MTTRLPLKTIWNTPQGIDDREISLAATCLHCGAAAELKRMAHSSLCNIKLLPVKTIFEIKCPQENKNKFPAGKVSSDPPVHKKPLACFHGRDLTIVRKPVYALASSALASSAGAAEASAGAVSALAGSSALASGSAGAAAFFFEAGAPASTN